MVSALRQPSPEVSAKAGGMFLSAANSVFTILFTKQLIIGDEGFRSTANLMTVL